MNIVGVCICHFAIELAHIQFAQGFENTKIKYLVPDQLLNSNFGKAAKLFFSASAHSLDTIRKYSLS